MILPRGRRQKRGFTRCVLPAVNVEKMEKTPALKNMQLMGVRTVDEAMERLF